MPAAEAASGVLDEVSRWRDCGETLRNWADGSGAGHSGRKSKPIVTMSLLSVEDFCAQGAMRCSFFAALRYLQTIEEVAILTCKLGFGASISNLIALSGVTSHGGAAVRHGLNWLQEFNSTRNAINTCPIALRSDVVEFDYGN